jgi:hypothetical protein
MDLNDLNGAQRAILEQAIVQGFTLGELDAALQHRDWEPIANFVPTGPWKQQVFELVRWSQRRGWTQKLVEDLQAENPDSSRIKTLYSDLGFARISGKDRERLDEGSLQKTVRLRAGYADLGPWLETFIARKHQVCRIEDAAQPLGTGFLVERDLVLTNYHVVDAYIDKGRSTAELACRFDYAVETGETNQGVVKRLAEGAGWIVDHAKFSPFDTGDRGGLPAPEELDYALIRLKEPAGDDPGQTGKARGWINVSLLPKPVEPKDICFILQHPKGDPVKVATGAVTFVNANATRVRYDTNTDSGSSGSPCLDVKLDLVALHHGGDPDTSRLAEFNQGIPIQAILKRMATIPGLPRFWKE